MDVLDQLAGRRRRAAIPILHQSREPFPDGRLPFQPFVPFFSYLSKRGKVPDLCGVRVVLQLGVSRGLSEVLLAPVGRVYLSEIVSKFEPKPGPRCRDSETQMVA